MPGPYYNTWKGPSRQHPSNEATPEEIRSLQTVEDVQRLFPDHPPPGMGGMRYKAGPEGQLVPGVSITDPEEIARLHVQSVRTFNPYTCEAWFFIWMRTGRLRPAV